VSIPDWFVEFPVVDGPADHSDAAFSERAGGGGILWALFSITRTTVSVPALSGCISLFRDGSIIVERVRTGISMLRRQNVQEGLRAASRPLSRSPDPCLHSIHTFVPNEQPRAPVSDPPS